MGSLNFKYQHGDVVGLDSFTDLLRLINDIDKQLTSDMFVSIFGATYLSHWGVYVASDLAFFLLNLTYHERGKFLTWVDQNLDLD